MPGIHGTEAYQIGNLVTKVNGREISLDMASDTAPTPKYPQITGIEYRTDKDGPQTILTLSRPQPPQPVIERPVRTVPTEVT